MGKRKKAATSNESGGIDVPVIKPKQVEPATAEHGEIETVKRSKRLKKMPQNIITTQLQKSKTVKKSMGCEEIEFAEEKDSSINIKPQKNKKKIKKLKETESKLTTEKKPKKVVFVDDEPLEVTESNTDEKQYLNDEEAAVKDEDIDKFCDEIDEEDNMQYENWIKLVEATLHPTKKKS